MSSYMDMSTSGRETKVSLFPAASTASKQAETDSLGEHIQCSLSFSLSVRIGKVRDLSAGSSPRGGASKTKEDPTHAPSLSVINTTFSLLPDALS